MLVLSPEVVELLDRPLVGHISTVSPSGKPQASIVWFERRGEGIIIFSDVAAPKVRNLRQNPSMELLVVDPERELGAGTPLYVRLTGRAAVRPREPDIEHRLARRYGHPDGYPKDWGEVGEIVTIWMSVERVSGVGPFAP